MKENVNGSRNPSPSTTKPGQEPRAIGKSKESFGPLISISGVY
jgi:hypothetical protein